MSRGSRSLQDRFRENVSPVTRGDCILWTGNIAVDGYGRIWHNGQSMRAHRVAWLLTHGELPTDKDVLHKCDNILCVNVEHLFLGTQATNCYDMAMKGRVRNQTVRLHLCEVEEIRRLYSTGRVSQRMLGKMFCISQTSIHDAIHAKTWAGPYAAHKKA